MSSKVVIEVAVEKMIGDAVGVALMASWRRGQCRRARQSSDRVAETGQAVRQNLLESMNPIRISIRRQIGGIVAHATKGDAGKSNLNTSRSSSRAKYPQYSVRGAP